MVMRYHLGFGVGHTYRTNGHGPGGSEGLRSMDSSDDSDVEDDELTTDEVPADGDRDESDSDESDSNASEWEDEEEVCSDSELLAMHEMYGS